MKVTSERRWSVEEILLLCAILLSSIAVLAKFNKNSTIFILLVTSFIFAMYKKIANLELTKRKLIIAGIYDLFLSLAIIAGSQVHYVEMRSKFTENYIVLDLSCICTGITLAFLLFPIIIIAITITEKFTIYRNAKTKLLNDKSFFIMAWTIIFTAWIPYLLTFYPGGLVGDGTTTLEVALQKGLPNHNHWVVLYILTLKFFLWIGRFISNDINVGPFLYVITESAVFSGVCAAISYKVRKTGIPQLLSWGTVLLYALSGFWATYGMSLWKDGLFSAGVVLIVLLLWEFPKSKEPSFKYCAKFGILSLFLCFWRNNGLYILVLCLLGFFILLKRQRKRILITGLLVVMCTAIIQGPVYNLLGIGKDSLIESFSVPLQQVAAAINNGTELTDSQKEILYATIPKEKWVENYCPTLSDDLKSATDTVYLESHASDFLKVWAQLLVPNFKTYVKAYLMQMLGYWQPGVYRGNYFDYWIGVEDIFHRGWSEKDLFRSMTGIVVKDELISRMNFIPSGCMVWLTFFSLAAIMSQKDDRRKRVLVLLPLIASWCVIMIAAPIAYAYRYIVMLPMAFPITCCLPFCHRVFGDIPETRNGAQTRFNNINYKYILIILALFIGIITVVLNLLSNITILKRYDGGSFDIYLAGEKYNATDYVIGGLSGNEGAFSWSDGNELSVEIPVTKTHKNLVVTLTVLGTFNGDKTYIIKQNDTIIANGTINGEGYIQFTIPTANRSLSFQIELPDAQRVCDVDKESTDTRKLALRLEKMHVETKD